MTRLVARYCLHCPCCGKDCAIGTDIFSIGIGTGWFCGEECAEKGPLRVSVADVVTRAGAVAFGNGWRARCPAHKSRGLTLSIGEGDNGGVILRCFAQCETSAVAAALGFEMANLAPPDKKLAHRAAAVQRPATSRDIGDALVAEAGTHRRKHGISDGERLLACDLNEIRHRVSVKLGISLEPVKRRASDSYAGGRERDPLWPILLDRGWSEAWFEYDNRLPCCDIDNFGAHGAIGFQLLEQAEQFAAAQIRLLAKRQRDSLKVAA